MAVNLLCTLSFLFWFKECFYNQTCDQNEIIIYFLWKIVCSTLFGTLLCCSANSQWCHSRIHDERWSLNGPEWGGMGTHFVTAFQWSITSDRSSFENWTCLKSILAEHSSCVSAHVCRRPKEWIQRFVCSFRSYKNHMLQFCCPYFATFSRCPTLTSQCLDFPSSAAFYGWRFTSLSPKSLLLSVA